MATNNQARLKQATDLHSAGKLVEAEEVYRELLDAGFRRADIKHLLGVARVQQGAVEDGVALIKEALKAKPRAATVHNHLANALMQLHRHEEALGHYRKALALSPKLADVLSNLGNVLLVLGEVEGAVKACEKALRISPKLAEGQLNLSLALDARGSLKEAVGACDRALRVSRTYPRARAQRASLAMRMCDWQVVDGLEILKGVEKEENNISPVCFLALSDDPLCQRKAAEGYLRGTRVNEIEADLVAKGIGGDRRKIGYLAPDFHDDAVMHRCLGMFRAHDREAFEVFALSVGPGSGGSMRTRVEESCEHFVNFHGLSDREIAEKIRELGIDVLVDLAGLTSNHRMGVLARRVAPVQVNYLGYPGTTGSSCHDYIVADGVVIPEGGEEGYSEEVMRLPGCYLATDDQQPVGAVPERRELGLLENQFVFCSLNGTQKISRSTFESWMRILGQVPDSVLWLLRENEGAEENLWVAAEAAGVSRERLVFASRIPAADHLGRLQQADLYLDTFPYTGHTTMADVLFVGVPGVTRMGRSFASRVAGSLLINAGLEELVTEDPSAYEKLAVELASDEGRLAELKKKLPTKVREGALFDSKAFTQRVEAAYLEMWKNAEG